MTCYSAVLSPALSEIKRSIFAFYLAKIRKNLAQSRNLVSYLWFKLIEKQQKNSRNYTQNNLKWNQLKQRKIRTRGSQSLILTGNSRNFLTFHITEEQILCFQSLKKRRFYLIHVTHAFLWIGIDSNHPRVSCESFQKRLTQIVISLLRDTLFPFLENFLLIPSIA